jgi:hypothetical protein
LGSDRAIAATSLNWERASLYGFQFGAGELRAQFSRGIVDIQPMSLEVNEGRLKLAPHVRISPEPKLLALEPGKVVEQVRITPATCARNAMPGAGGRGDEPRAFHRGRLPRWAARSAGNGVGRSADRKSP